MPVFKEFLSVLKADLLELAREFGEEITEELMEDGQAFAITLREDLERWTKQLGRGSLSREEFAFLIAAKKDLAEMEALKQKGLAEAKIDKLRIALVDRLIGSVFKVLT